MQCRQIPYLPYVLSLLYLPFSLSLPLLSCNSDKKAKQQIFALKEMSDLATVEYVVTKIIKASDDKTWYKVGDRKILMSCKATLKAGVDFSQINSENVHLNGDAISIQLPRAKLLSINIKPEDIKTEYEEVGLFRNEFSAAEKDALMNQGETQITNSVDSLGILQTAETNASLFVSNFLHQLGYKNVTVNFAGRTIHPKLD